MITDEQKKLCEESMRLIGYPRHESGQEWPALPFYYVGEDGITGIRWNDSDIAFIERTVPSGRVDNHEITETWVPTYRIEQAMRLWKDYPPERQWLELQIGKDGWIVKLLYHHETGYIHEFSTDDDAGPTLAHAITEAWVAAMTQQINELPTA